MTHAAVVVEPDGKRTPIKGGEITAGLESSCRGVQLFDQTGNEVKGC